MAHRQQDAHRYQPITNFFVNPHKRLAYAQALCIGCRLQTRAFARKGPEKEKPGGLQPRGCPFQPLFCPLWAIS